MNDKMVSTKSAALDSSWFVIQTKPKKEPLVAGLLKQAGHQIFLPKMRRFGRLTEPLFPRYCFICSDMRDAYIWQLVRYTRGVSQVLSDDTGPVAVSGEVIQSIQAVAAKGEVIEQELLYHPGDSVMVTKGVLQDLVGIVERNLSESGRVRVLFKWLSKKMVADLDYRLLARVA